MGGPRGPGLGHLGTVWGPGFPIEVDKFHAQPDRTPKTSCGTALRDSELRDANLWHPGHNLLAQRVLRRLRRETK